jgi:hypothetical protein
VPGFPIRTPWDHSLVDSSPRPIAASHVLHRLLVPRHSPFALDNLTTKMLASTVQFSTNDQPTTRSAPHQTRQPPAVCEARPCLAAREAQHAPLKALKDNQRLFLQDPTGCSTSSPSRTRTPFHTTKGGRTRRNPAVAEERLTSVSAIEHPDPTFAGRGLLAPFRVKVLLRKEVIQPHLPVRLPCYDFVPIASPTFDGSLPYGLGHRLRVLPTFVT